MFPVVILLYIWWRRGRVTGRDLRASLPFFGVSVVLGVVTAWFQWHRAMAGTDYPLGAPLARLGAAGMAVVFYFFKCVCPLHLQPVYANWGPHPGWFRPLASWLLIALVFGCLWRRRAGWGRPALFGLGFFAVNLLPVLGFVPMSFLRLSRVSDHLCYLPLVGIVGLVVALRFRTVVLALLCLALAWIGHDYARIFRDQRVFWTYALEGNPDAWVGHNNLGNILTDAGEVDAAAAHYRRAFELFPDYAEAHNNLGNRLLDRGRVGEAIAQYREALRILPAYAMPQNGIGVAFLRTGRPAEAMAHFQAAVRIENDFAEGHYNWGLALAKLGRPLEAIAQYRVAIGYKPDYPDAHFDLGRALAEVGDLAAAGAEFQAVIRLRPDAAVPHQNLGLVLQALGRSDEAAVQLRIAEELRRGRAPAGR